MLWYLALADAWFRWHRFDGRPHIENFQPLDAGREADGTLCVLALLLASFLAFLFTPSMIPHYGLR
jgi:hypothetical protein